MTVEAELKMLPAGVVEDAPVKEYVGNTNTGKCHVPGCKAIDRMLPEHKVATDGTGFSKCAWCFSHPEKVEKVLEELLDNY